MGVIKQVEPSHVGVLNVALINVGSKVMDSLVGLAADDLYDRKWGIAGL